MSKLLIVMHNPVMTGKLGGVELHVAECVQAWRHDLEIAVLSGNDRGELCWQSFVGNDSTVEHLGALTSSGLADWLERWGRPDLVHYHHLLNVPAGLPDLMQLWQVPQVLTIHDYAVLCPKFTLTTPGGHYCGLPDLDAPEHAACLAHIGKSDVDLGGWRQRSQNILDKMDLVICVDDDVRDRLWPYFSVESGAKPRWRVLPVGIPFSVPDVRPVLKCGPRSICFLGALQPQKGRAFIMRLSSILAAQGCTVHLLGESESSRLNVPDQVVCHGPYGASEVIERLQKIAPQMVGLVSPWPETFSRTLSEAWAAGIPAVVSPLGALQARVHRSGAGWVLSSLDPQIAATEILGIFADGADYRAKQEAARRVPVATVASVQRRLLAAYEELGFGATSHPVPALRGSAARGVESATAAGLSSSELLERQLGSRPLARFIWRLSTIAKGSSLRRRPGQYRRNPFLMDSVFRTPEQVGELLSAGPWGWIRATIIMTYLNVSVRGWGPVLRRPLAKLRAAITAARPSGFR